jgi:hypothetical protein
MYNTDLPTRAELPSAMKLMQSTILAAIVALTLLITIVMPSEYGIDPTGVGRLLGLKEMGEIKTQLAEEAAADKAGTSPLAQQTAPVNERPVPDNPPTITQNNYPELSVPATTRAPEAPTAGSQRNQLLITLKPNEAAEVKMEMRKDARVAYQWMSSGPVNVDAHGDPVNARKGFTTAMVRTVRLPLVMACCRPPLTESMAGSGEIVVQRRLRSNWIPMGST